MRRVQQSAGFTLIELMIVVAIIGILAAIAIPNFVRFQLRAKAGEGKLNLTAIRASQAAYFGEYGTYISMDSEPSTSGPDGAIGSVKRRWARCGANLTMGSPGHCIVGFFPEGPTYFDYALATNGPANTGLGPGSIATEFFADAVADIDDNGDVVSFGLRITESGAEDGTGFSVGAGPGGCTEVLDELGNDALYGLVGPCGVGMGQTIF